MFGQTFHAQDLAVIGLLVVLEGILSIDNALVLGLLAKRLPKQLRSKALTYGLVGAFIFRFIAIGAASYLLQWRVVKLLGGGYLVWVAAHHFFQESRKKRGAPVTADAEEASKVMHGQTSNGPAPAGGYPGFWSTVMVIELTDIAFAIDSILAAIALVGSAPAGHHGPHPKLWVVITGGMLGVILMRFAAVIFIKLLERFPRFETSAYLLVIVIGFKLIADWAANTPAHPHALNFHDPGGAPFWVFWALMAVCLAIGFLPQKKAEQTANSRG